MDKKPLTKFLDERYADLDKAEKALRKRLERLYSAHIAELTELLTVSQPANHAALMARMTPQERDKINWDKHRTLLDFDEVNKLDYVHARVALSEYELADREYDLIYDHLILGIAATTATLAAYMSVRKNVPEKSVMQKGRTDLKKTLYDNARHRADQAVTDWERGIIRGVDAQKNAEDTAYDNAKRERASSDRIIYTEGTRTTTDAIIETLSDVAQYVRSVTVKDGKACVVCRDIEREQETNPVPIKEASAGVNVPPFHPYCRCHIEVIYDDED